MPADVFRMLICGPGNAGKTTILLHLLYRLLAHEKVYLFSEKSLWKQIADPLARLCHQNLNPQAGSEVIEAPGGEIIHLEELPVDNQKIVVFDDLVCESNQKAIFNYLINGWHRN